MRNTNLFEICKVKKYGHVMLFIPMSCSKFVKPDVSDVNVYSCILTIIYCLSIVVLLPRWDS